MKKLMGAIVGAFAAAAVLCGCGESVDENKSAADVQAEAAKLDASALQAKVEACKKAIEAKKVEAEALTAKLKEIPLKDQLGAEAKDLQSKLAQVGDSVQKLTAQMDVYAKELQAKAAAK